MSPIWIIPVLAVLGGLAVAVTLGRHLAQEARQLGTELDGLRALGPELTGLWEGVEHLAGSVTDLGRR